MPYLALIDLLGSPENASAHGVLIDNMNNFVHWFMLILLVGWGAFFIYCLFRFNAKAHPKADYYGVRTHLSTHLEIGVIITEVMLLLGFAFPLWTERVYELPESRRQEAVHVRVIGSQFMWEFHYPGADGMFGITRPELAGPGNPTTIGLDPSDPPAADDFYISNVLTIPVGRPIILDITSKDVIHNFALHNMRVAQDAIPGLQIAMWFEPTKIGSYEAVCGQLCGSGHYSMKGMVEVVSQEDYDKWLRGRTPALGTPAPATAQVTLPGTSPNGG